MTLQLETMLKEGLRLRSATMDDAELVARLARLHYTRLQGNSIFSTEQMRDEWQNPGFELEKDVRLIVTDDNEVVGYMGAWNTSPPHVNNWANFCVDPEYLGQGIGTALTRWAIKRAQEKFHLAPEDAQIIIAAAVQEKQDDARELLTNEGFKLVRHWYQMRIDMDEAPPEAQFPDNIKITTHAELGDLLRIIRADEEAFRDHYGFIESDEDDLIKDWEHWIATNPFHDDDLWFLATDGDEIAGICLCQFGLNEDPDMAYVDSMAVRRAWRKQGIALGLLHHAFGKIYERGIKKIVLDVDASSLTGATRLYEKAGMRVYRRSDRYEMVLRDGKDYRTQALDES